MTYSNISQQLHFPDLLYTLLEDCERYEEFNIISWSPKGNSFKVHNKEVFTQSVLPRYFRQSKYKSFARQLNVWGFLCGTDGSDKGYYSHRHFQRGKRELVRMIKRVTKTPAMWDPRVDQEFARLIALAFDRDKRQPQTSIQLPALETHQLKDAILSIVPDPPLHTIKASSQPYAQVLIPQAKRVPQILQLPSRHVADTSPAAIASMREPVQDWLTCLEELFDLPVCHHAKQRGPCDLFRVKTKHDDQKSCSDEPWSSWDFLEPCPLNVAMADGATTYRCAVDTTNSEAWSKTSMS